MYFKECNHQYFVKWSQEGDKGSAPKRFFPGKLNNDKKIMNSSFIEQKVFKITSTFIKCKVKNRPLKLQSKSGLNS